MLLLQNAAKLRFALSFMTQGKLAQCFSTWRAIAAYIRPMRQRVAQLQAKQAAREGREALQSWRHTAHLGRVSRMVS